MKQDKNKEIQEESRRTAERVIRYRTPEHYNASIIEVDKKKTKNEDKAITIEMDR